MRTAELHRNLLPIVVAGLAVCLVGCSTPDTAPRNQAAVPAESASPTEDETDNSTPEPDQSTDPEADGPHWVTPVDDDTWILNSEPTDATPGQEILIFENSNGCLIYAAQFEITFDGTGSEIEETAVLLESIVLDGNTDPSYRTVVDVTGEDEPVQFLYATGSVNEAEVDSTAWILARALVEQETALAFSLICETSLGVTEDDFNEALELFQVVDVDHPSLT